MSVGSYIREVRKDKGLMQKEFAEQVGVSQQTICYIEKEHTKPSITTLRKIAEVLEVPYYELRRMLKGIE